MIRQKIKFTAQTLKYIPYLTKYTKCALFIIVDTFHRYMKGNSSRIIRCAYKTIHQRQKKYSKFLNQPKDRENRNIGVIASIYQQDFKLQYVGQMLYLSNRHILGKSELNLS